jgi:single-stranded-DNA-specific exonuclease
MGQIEKMLKKGDLPKIIILHSPKWHEGVIGLIASNVLEKYYRPVIVMNESDGQLKGSARSIPSFHITQFFTELKEYFLNFGGHAGAAGFTLEKKKLEKFIKTAEKLAGKKIKDSDLEKKVEVDIKIPVSVHSLQLAKAIESLKPFGIGNSQPTFASEVEIVSAKLLGKTNDHLKLSVKDPTGDGCPIEMVAFKKGNLFDSLSRGQKIMIIYQLDINRWNGKETLQGKIQHFLSAEDTLS